MTRLIPIAIATLASVSAYAATYQFKTTSLDSMEHGTAYTWGLTNSTDTGSNPLKYTDLVSDVSASGHSITSASLTISNLYDWTVEAADVLYIDVLNKVGNGNDLLQYNSNPSTNDTSFGPNIFNPATLAAYPSYVTDWVQSALPFESLTTPTYTQSLLVGPTSVTNPGTWSDPNGGISGKTTLVITFSSGNLSLLENFLEHDSSTGANNTVGLGFAAECHFLDSGMTLTINTGTTPPPVGVPDSGNTLLLLGATFISLAGLRRRLLVSK